MTTRFRSAAMALVCGLLGLRCNTVEQQCICAGYDRFDTPPATVPASDEIYCSPGSWGPCWSRPVGPAVGLLDYDGGVAEYPRVCSATELARACHTARYPSSPLAP